MVLTTHRREFLSHYPMTRLIVLAMLAFARLATAQEIPFAHNLPPGERPLEVSVLFHLDHVHEMNEENETVEIKGLLGLRWHDERQAFDPTETGASEKHYQGTFQFLEEYNAWWPQVYLPNGAEPTSLQGVSLRITPDGSLFFLQEISAVVDSPMNFRRYPFDRQQLQVIFQVLAFDAHEVKLVAWDDEVILPQRYIRIAGWKLRDASIETGLYTAETLDHPMYPTKSATIPPTSQFIVKLNMARRPGYTIWYVMVPLSLIVLLSTTIFWMDRESLSSRMDISFIGILTIVAYQATVDSGLPNISYFTLLNGFVYVAYFTMASCVVGNLWVDHLNHRGAVAAADRFDQWSRWLFPAGFVVLNTLSALYFYFM